MALSPAAIIFHSCHGLWAGGFAAGLLGNHGRARLKAGRSRFWSCTEKLNPVRLRLKSGGRLAVCARAFGSPRPPIPSRQMGAFAYKLELEDLTRSA
jgi:hypothetical protein